MALIHGLTQHHMGNITLSFNHFAFICHPRSSQVGETIKLRIALSSDTLQLIQLHDFMQCHVHLRSIQHILCRSHCLSSAGSQHIQCLLRICVTDLCNTVCNLIHLQMEDGGSELVRKLPLFHAHVLRTGHTPSLTGAQQGKIHTAQRIDQVPGLSQRLQLVQKLFVIGMSVHRDIGDILHLQGSPHVLYAAQSKGFGVRNRPQCGRHLHLIDQDVGQRIHDPSNVNHSQSIDACTIEFLSSLKCFSRSPNSGLCYVSINSGLCQGLFRRLQKTLGALTAAFVMTGYTDQSQFWFTIQLNHPFCSECIYSGFAKVTTVRHSTRNPAYKSSVEVYSSGL